MLTHLRIEHFAIISTCEVDFSAGFTVFTGETGAGKSIIVDAIGLLLGQPSTDTVIQFGHDAAIIEGTFTLQTIPDVFSPYIEPGDPLIVYRKVSRKKENLVRINGQTVPLKVLKHGMAQIMNIIGQHEHMHLLDADKQLAYVDAACSDALAPLQTAYKAAYVGMLALQKQLTQLQQAQQDKDTKQGYLEFQCRDIAEHTFVRGEEELWLDQKRLAQQGTKLKQHLQSSLTHMDRIVSELETLTKPLGHLCDLDVEFTPILDYTKLTKLTIGDYQDIILNKLHQISGATTKDLDHIESRLDIIFRYKTKYHHPTLDALLDYYDTVRQQLDTYTNFDEHRLALEADYTTAQQQTIELGHRLTAVRQAAALHLNASMTDCLKKLHFLDPDFQIMIQSTESPGPLGLDTVTFCVRTNPGEPLNPLAKVASGGELSRIMLAIKTIFLKFNPVPTLIFDEVDTGIGGLTANTIGDFLHQISQFNQVLCVTHLPQIARLATHHFVVNKAIASDRTETTVNELTVAEVKSELVRMVGGDVVLHLI